MKQKDFPKNRFLDENVSDDDVQDDDILEKDQEKSDSEETCTENTNDNGQNFRAKRLKKIEKDEEDDDDDIEEEEEESNEHATEEEEESDRDSRHHLAKRFLDIEAEVSEEEEEEEEEEMAQLARDFIVEGEEEGDFDRTEASTSALARARQEAEEQRKLRFLRQQALKQHGLDVEAETKRIEETYGRSAKSRTLITDQDFLSSTASRNLALPPAFCRLWLVKCRPGKEMAIIHGLLQVVPSISNLIKAIMVKDTLKGFIYVEAGRVADLIHGLKQAKVDHFVFGSASLVPAAEMSQVMQFVTTTNAGETVNSEGPAAILPKSDTWIRVKRGKYAGDLARVISVDPRNQIVLVKLIPRLPSSTSTGKNGVKPSLLQQRLFDPKEMTIYGSVGRTRGYWTFKGEKFKDGLVYKELKAVNLTIGVVQPKPSELVMFGFNNGEKTVKSGVDQNNRDQSFSLISILDDYMKPKTWLKIPLSEGELVEVTDGELIGLLGHVTKMREESTDVDKDSVSAIIDIDLISSQHKRSSAPAESLQMSASLVRRKLYVGDQVLLMHKKPDDIGDEGDPVTANIVDVEENLHTSSIMVTVYEHHLGIQWTVSEKCVRQISSELSSTNQAPSLITASSSNKRSQQIQTLPLNNHRHHLLGKTVSIVSGPFKGYVGIVKQLTDQIARIELTSTSKIVSVNKDSITGDSQTSNLPSSNHKTSLFIPSVGRTIATATPSINPLLRSSLGKTPTWNPNVGKTPTWNPIQSKTPTWNPSPKTPTWSTLPLSTKTPSWSSLKQKDTSDSTNNGNNKGASNVKK